MVTERDIRTEQKRDAIDHAARIWDKYYPRMQAYKDRFNIAVSQSQNPKGEE